MTVKQLMQMLSKLPPDMEVLNGRYSDYEIVQESECSVVEAVPQDGGWLMRAHPTMSEQNKRKAKLYFAIEGN